MRLIKRETKKRAVLSVVFGLLLLVGIFCAFFLSAATTRRIYEKELEAAEIRISVLEKEKRTATRQVFKAVEDIKSGEKITEEKVVRAEVFSEMEKTLYMTEEGIGKVSRIDISAGTFITDSMVYSKGEAVFSEVGYRNINVQGNISEEDFIDVRIFYPNGEDMKVLSGKRVEGIENASVIYMRLTEEEMLMMASAITDISCMGAELYTVKCCMPGECEGEVNYLPSEQVLGLIEECTGEDFITDKAECIEKRRQLEKRVLGG